jgi:hypothetical protein
MRSSAFICTMMLFVAGLIGIGVSPACVAQQQTSPMATPTPKSKPATFNTIQLALYQALDREQSTDSVSLLIKQNLDAISRSCEQVMAYQIFRYKPGNRTLKIKCARQSLMAMTIGRNGGVQVIGGDGSIGDMLASDGRIYSVMGQTLRTYMAEQKVRDDAAAKSRNIVPITEPQVAAPSAPPGWSMPFIIINCLLIALAAFLLWRFVLARPSAHDHGWALSSTDKDYMMDESQEVYPNVFRHPRGFFISRGKRGKRRLFNNAFAAMLYRDLGIKIGEIGD